MTMRIVTGSPCIEGDHMPRVNLRNGSSLRSHHFVVAEATTHKPSVLFFGSARVTEGDAHQHGELE